MRKNSYVITTIIICIILLSLSVLLFTSTYAIWVENEEGSMFVKVSILDENPSVKYQMFVPLSATHNTATDDVSAFAVINGTFDISNGVYTYTLTNPAEANNIVGFAVAGWFGGVQLEYIEIPSSITYSITAGTINFFGNNDNNEKDVVRIMPLKSMAAYKIAGDLVLEKIVIGENVVEIDKAVCSGILNLKTIIYKSSEEGIYVRPYAFSGCVHLTTIDCPREIISDETTIYLK